MHQYFIPNFFLQNFAVVNENITFSLHDGDIWKHLLHRKCVNLYEHGNNILFTSAFKMAEIYRFIQICLHGTSKKSIVFLPLLFSGQSINQSIHINIFFARRMFREMRYRPYCFVIHRR